MTYQDQPDNRDYSAPIPPLDDTRRRRDEPRHLHTEPLPPRSPFAGMAFPGMWPGGRPGMQPGMRTGVPLILPRKSLLLASVLAALLGPLGMLYSTFLGAFVMMGVWFWTLLLFGGAFPFAWVWGILWALWAAHRKNERRGRMETYLRQM